MRVPLRVLLFTRFLCSLGSESGLRDLAPRLRTLAANRSLEAEPRDLPDLRILQDQHEKLKFDAMPDPCSMCAGSDEEGVRFSTKPTRPAVVIPFWDHDLCKMKYTARSITLQDADGHLGRVYLIWVSKTPSSEHKGEIDEIVREASGNHPVTFLDFSDQVNAEPMLGGWYAQQVLKLKMASRIASDFYVVLDSKNALIRKLTGTEFINQCNAGYIFGRYRHDHIPHPHADWYEASAEVLGVNKPVSGYWPASITPMVLHKRTVLNMLASIGEKPSVDKVCAGPLCKMLGACTKTGKGATEFTMYTLYAYSDKDFSCTHAIEVPPNTRDLAQRWAVSLWRGEVNREKNLRRARLIASGRHTPIMFGAQAAALEDMTHLERNQVSRQIAKVFKDSGLYRSSDTLENFIECVVGNSSKPSSTGTTTTPGLTTTTTTTDASRIAGDFCCFAAWNHGNICGTCYPAAIEQASGWCGASSSNCWRCKGTWCMGPKKAKVLDKEEWSCRVPSGSAALQEPTTTSNTTTATTTAATTTTTSTTRKVQPRWKPRAHSTTKATTLITTSTATTTTTSTSTTTSSSTSSTATTTTVNVASEDGYVNQGVEGMEHEDEVSWEPLDMPNSSPVPLDSPKECQQICAKTPGCVHFSYWKNGQKCHLQDAFAARRPHRPDWVSGPFKDWSELDHSKYAVIGNLTYVPKDLECLETSTLWSPIFGVPTYFSQVPDTLVAIRQCQELCVSVPGCAHWSFMLSGKLCRLARDSAWRLADVFVVSATPGCKQQGGHALESAVLQTVDQDDQVQHRLERLAGGPVVAGAFSRLQGVSAMVFSTCFLAGAAYAVVGALRRTCRTVGEASARHRSDRIVQAYDTLEEDERRRPSLQTSQWEHIQE